MDYQLEMISLIILICSVMLLGKLINIVASYNDMRLEMLKEQARQEKIDNLYGRERE